MEYSTLDPDKTVETIEQLQRRIAERFPDAGLGRVCERLLRIGRRAKEQAAVISRPSIFLRAVMVVLVLALAGPLVVLFEEAARATVPEGVTLADMIQALDAGMNALILIAAGVFFLLTVDIRLRRSRVLRALHELRVIAHVIDMHQLTKDPVGFPPAIVTPSSPKRDLTAFALNRYLDYCSEMLSLTGKIAVLYVQKFDDPAAVTAVNEIENLTNGLSRKIWQKLMILQALEPRE